MPIIVGDSLTELKKLPADHFDCVVTSPPYWGLRDYGIDGQIGLEQSLDEYISKMVEVCAEIHRTLKPSGTFWLNIGDCYAGGQGGRGDVDRKIKRTDGSSSKPSQKHDGARISRAIPDHIKAKDLCMVPNRLAIALQEWGWWVRSEIIWAKPNPMPESVTDRPATAHEKIWMLTKAARYHYDGDAVRIQARWPEGPNAPDKIKSPYGQGFTRTSDKQRGHGRRHAGFNDRWESEKQASGRNLRNYEPAPVQVWPIATRPFPGAHFATFPAELVERCLLAGCPKGGDVLDPFGGAGTVGLVADAIGLDWTLIELNPEYAAMAESRIKARITKTKGPRSELCSETPSLFE